MSSATRSKGPGQVLLTWALDRTGRRVRVGELDARRRHARGPFACVACGERVVARLGPVRAHHFAHGPGSRCALTSPETLAHIEAKERLLFLCGEALSRRLRVSLRSRCPECRREAPLDLATCGDAASAESGAGAVRPDVLVTRDGRPSLALEVKVTHAVDEAKRQALARLGLPTLEVDASEPWEEERPDGSLAIRISRTLGTEPCGSCQAARRADAERGRGGEAAAVAELEAYRGRGLLGPSPGPALSRTEPFSEAERRRLCSTFLCPECGRPALLMGERLARHPCHGAARPVAWRGYDGALVELEWWRR